MKTTNSRATVLAVRDDGRRVVFGTYERTEAERVAASLRRNHCGAEVVDADQAPATPGAAANAGRDE